MSDNRPRILGVNMTNFFNRTLYMYSFGDIQFKKPISLKLMAWTLAWFCVWSIPILVLTGFSFKPVILIIALVPPIAFGRLSITPIFAGKTLVDFAKTMFKHASEPRGWTDLNNNSSLDSQVLYVESEIWISRRRELRMLADLKELNKNNKKRKR